MTTTTIATGWLVPADRQGWSRDDWADHFMSDSPCLHGSFCFRIIGLADEDTLLSLERLERLLFHHGVTLATYRKRLDESKAHGAAVLPLSHAGQALTFLGY